jgi:hypothetical protein
MRNRWCVIIAVSLAVGGASARGAEPKGKAGTAPAKEKKITVYPYPGALGTIPQLENFIRHNPTNPKVPAARDMIIQKASPDPQWLEVNKYFAKLADIEGARYDEENDRLVIWGPELDEKSTSTMPPLLVDDFAVALAVLEAGKKPGVNIGPIAGRLTGPEVMRLVRIRRVAVEYIPPSTFGTHMGLVLLEIDRCLKNLTNGKDNLTLQPVKPAVEGFVPMVKLVRFDQPTTKGMPLVPYGRWWFVPDESGVACEGYTMKFVSHRIPLRYAAYVRDDSIEKFGNHINEHFDEYARELTVFRELVRLHKLVQVAQWYKDSKFPTESFLKRYKPLAIRTPSTTRRISKVVRRNVSGQQWDLGGGVIFALANKYFPVSSVPAPQVALGAPPARQLERPVLALASAGPPRYGSFGATRPPTPAFAVPVFEARPSPSASGWTAAKGSLKYAVVSVPAQQGKTP